MSEAGGHQQEAVKVFLLVTYLDGDAPVQALGYINGYPFYFRARGERWRFAVANVRGDHREAIRVATGEQPGFLLERRYGRERNDASVLSYSLAMGIIRRAARAFLAFSAHLAGS
jgi:hypothetical protein